MNSDPNSDSEQCTKSKLGRVHSAHTHGPGCAHYAQAARTPSVGRRVVARRASYRGRVAPRARHVTALCRTHCCSVSTQRPFPFFAIQKLYRDIELMSRAVSLASPVMIQSLYRNTGPCRAHCALCRARYRGYRSSLRRIMAHCCAVSQPLVRCVATPGLPLLSRYNHLYRDTPQQPGHERARYCSPRSQAGRVAAPAGGVVAVSCLAMRACYPASQALPVTIQNIVS